MIEKDVKSIKKLEKIYDLAVDNINKIINLKNG